MAAACQATAIAFPSESAGASLRHISATSRNVQQKICRTSYAASLSVASSLSEHQRWRSSFSYPALASADIANGRHYRGLVMRPFVSGLGELAACFETVLASSSRVICRVWRRESAIQSSALSRKRCSRTIGGSGGMSSNRDCALSLSSGCHERIIGAGVVLRAATSAENVETSDAVDVQVDPSVMAMVQSTIAEKISEDVSKVGADMALSDLGIDSLDQVEIMMAFEEKCGVSVEDGGSEGGAESMKTVKDVAILLQKLIAKKKSSEDS